jgi:hypothetical protein
MRTPADVLADLYTIAWVGLVAILVFYLAVGIALRWRPRRTVHVTRYEPPEGISPAVAAFLFESGRCEQAFAAALVSLASKKYLRISQESDRLTLEKLREPDRDIPAEESAILSALFPYGSTCSFNSSDSFEVLATYKDFRGTIHGIATSEWMSTHVVLWLVGLCYSLTVLEPIIFSMPGLGHGMPWGSFVFMGMVVLAGCTSFVAALRVWPSLLRKLGTYLPASRRPRRPLTLNDAIPIFLTGTAAFGFVFLSVLTTTKLALLLAGALAINVFSWHLMNAPTSAGRRALRELSEFREFLSRTETDRLNRLNKPGSTPEALELHNAYAVALGIERGWGEEFAMTILEFVQVDEAYDISATIPEPDPSPKTLSLFGRTK